MYIFSLTFFQIFIFLQILNVCFQDLENYIRNHPDSRFDKLQEIGKQLVDSDIMTRTIQSDVESLTSRWGSLNKQVLFSNI